MSLTRFNKLWFTHNENTVTYNILATQETHSTVAEIQADATGTWYAFTAADYLVNSDTEFEIGFYNLLSSTDVPGTWNFYVESIDSSDNSSFDLTEDQFYAVEGRTFISDSTVSGELFFDGDTSNNYAVADFTWAESFNLTFNYKSSSDSYWGDTLFALTGGPNSAHIVVAAGESSTESRRLFVYGVNDSGTTSFSEVATSTTNYAFRDGAEHTVTLDFTGTVLSVYLDSELALTLSYDWTEFAINKIMLAAEDGTSAFVGNFLSYTFYDMTITGDITHDWNAAYSGGSGLLLPDIESGNDFTLMNFAGDDSQWTYDDGQTDAVAPTDPTVTVTPDETSAEVFVNTAENDGTIWYLINQSATATEAEVLAGSYTSAGNSGADSVADFTASDLTVDTTYYVHIIHQDLAGNNSGVVSTSFTTTAAATNSAPVFYDRSFDSELSSQSGDTIGTVTGYDDDGDTLTYSTAETDIAIDGSTGVITWVNVPTVAGDYDYVVVASDGTDSTSATITVSVYEEAPVNTAPVINNQSFTDATDSVTGGTIGTLTATDTDSDTLTFSTSSTNINVNSSTGVITWAVDPTAQTYTETVTVSDGADTDSATVTIVVSDVYVEPTASITLTSSATYVLTRGYAWDNQYISYTALDAEGADATSAVVMDDASVDVDTVGTYNVTLELTGADPVTIKVYIVAEGSTGTGSGSSLSSTNVRKITPRRF